MNAFLIMGLALAISDTRADIERLLSRVNDNASKTDLLQISSHPEATLLEVAQDARVHTYVRERAVVALGHFESPWTVASLTELLSDRHPAIRQSAAYVLGRYFGQTMPEVVFHALQPTLADPESSVRRQAVRGMSYVAKREVVAALNARLSFEADAELRDFIFYRARQLDARNQLPSSPPGLLP